MKVTEESWGTRWEKVDKQLKRRWTEKDGVDGVDRERKRDEGKEEQRTRESKGEREEEAEGRYCTPSLRCFPTSQVRCMEKAVNGWIKNEDRDESAFHKQPTLSSVNTAGPALLGEPSLVIQVTAAHFREVYQWFSWCLEIKIWPVLGQLERALLIHWPNLVTTLRPL